MINQQWTKSIDDMPVNEAITIYYEKHHALRTGDLNTLREIKNKCPDIFDNEKDIQIMQMIEDIKTFQNSTHYKELQKLEMKKKLFVTKNASE